MKDHLEITWRTSARKAWSGLSVKRGGEFTNLLVVIMLKVTLECKNARSENIAELLNEFTDSFNVWFHNSALYAHFDLKSLWKLFELTKKLENMHGVEQ